MAKIKICGLTNHSDILQATNLGADFLGFHLIKESPKKVSIKFVKDTVSKLPPFVTPVGIFSNEEKVEIEKTLHKTGLKVIQLNGSETPEICNLFRTAGIKVFKYFKVGNDESVFSAIEAYRGKIDYLILDFSFSVDQEQQYDFNLPLKAPELGIPFFLSGTKVEDIKQSIEKIMPFGFDIDSQIERLPTRKDYDKMSIAIKLAHGIKV
ncbi:MAG: phosphoribosylanthranilate isomerase [Elusimicrobiota bacterium]|jgi:phosphoribosylanthranilate isomerase|nr:phosphoribosylanthranilate isomerase [Elusimicrobiota bacterium]